MLNIKYNQPYHIYTNIASIYSAEIIAINLALDIIATTPRNKIIILTLFICSYYNKTLNRIYHLSKN